MVKSQHHAALKLLNFITRAHSFHLREVDFTSLDHTECIIPLDSSKRVQQVPLFIRHYCLWSKQHCHHTDCLRNVMAMLSNVLCSSHTHTFSSFFSRRYSGLPCFFDQSSRGNRLICSLSQVSLHVSPSFLRPVGCSSAARAFPRRYSVRAFRENTEGEEKKRKKKQPHSIRIMNNNK